MIIIGFGHKKRVGKDQAVKFAMSFARQHYPKLNVQVFSFGDMIKEVAYTMFKWGGLEPGIYYENNPQLIEKILPPIGRSPRQIWDMIGLMGREICPVIWPQAAISSLTQEPDVLLCKDVRFPTEIKLIKEFQGYVFKLNRPGVEPGGQVDLALDSYDGWSGIIENDKGLKSLNGKIKGLTAQILNKLVETTQVICPNCFAREPVQVGPIEFSCKHCNLSFNFYLYPKAQ